MRYRTMTGRSIKYVVPVIVVLVLGVVKGYRSQYEQILKQQAERLYVDFDQSMNKDKYPHAWSSGFTQEMYPLLRQHYKHTNLTKVQPSYTPRVPKIIHQIWLGSPFPEEFKANQQSWLKHHPGWAYKLWTDDNIKEFGTLENQDLFDASLNYGEKSDILRYELLYRLGGVYIDVDFECLKPLDLFNHCYDLYVGIQTLDTNYAQLGIGLIGSMPGHPLLKHTIENIRNNKTDQIIVRTGPIHFSRVFYSYVESNPSTFDGALPATYFYPKGYYQRDEPASVWQRPESFAVHHWASSWKRPQGYVRTW